MDQLALPAPTPKPLPAPIALPDLVAAWLEGRKASTVKGYSQDLTTFARFLGLDSPGRAVERLIALPAGEAHALVLAFRNALLERGLATATVCRCLAALRSITKLARQLGRVAWMLEVEGPRIERRRDTRGPDQDDFAKLWKAAKKIPGAKGARDRALIALLYGMAFRRAEVLALDLADLDLDRQTVRVLGKGRREPVPIDLPPKVMGPLKEWVGVRGDAPGPLFPRFDRAGTGRLTGDGLADMLTRLGTAAKLPRKVLPHGLRHASITAALENGADIRRVRKFSRHQRLETVLIYDDERGNAALEVARSVSKALK